MKLGVVMLFTLLVGIVMCSSSCSSSSKELSPDPVKEALSKIENGAVVVDVRTPDEFAAGHLEGAINIPYDQIANRIAEISEDPSSSVVLYCRSGRRAGIAERTLRSNGFEDVVNGGGYKDLKG